MIVSRCLRGESMPRPYGRLLHTDSSNLVLTGEIRAGARYLLSHPRLHTCSSHILFTGDIRTEARYTLSHPPLHTCSSHILFTGEVRAGARYLLFTPTSSHLLFTPSVHRRYPCRGARVYPMFMYIYVSVSVSVCVCLHRAASPQIRPT